MRFARALISLLLLVIGVPALAAGGLLWTLARHTHHDGSLHARFEPVRTSGHAVVVTDVAELLRRDIPFVRPGPARMRLTASTADGPAFIGLAPTADVRRWLGDLPYATVARVAPTRGPLPVRLDEASGAAPATPGPGPVGRAFWLRAGTGSLDWDPAELGDRALSLVLMRPDGRADLALDVHAELRMAWLAPARWALPPVGLLAVVLALVLLRPVPPREVVFVAEPDQVPFLAARLGVTSLRDLGAPPRPATLADLPVPDEVGDDLLPMSEPRPADSSSTGCRSAAAPALAWPPLVAEETARPVEQASSGHGS